MARRSNNTTANEETPKQETQEEAKKVETTDKSAVATYPDKEAEEVQVKAAKGTQLYNPVTRTLYTDKKAKDANMSDQFVVTNLKRGKLKKA